ncbi:LytTR family DNA-binding domain-containing protein [Oceanihabitans sediminis]|uniref:DNA-binding response regulator n=1 Tax=Oceanihabitans sediminis TaxID=1812012 RepID=A0A368P2S8_9FLAO|nr:response regulator [Oceanihabitans sediminis]MDX1277442.1 DNA-binding response regulator [Oceanihabitans sediminis]MDX1774239.1 DNA-binding response regulator [Oceanihabitans sediminis]RBP30751.1 LytTR family two component transcriptional regulator [Oceanihabitans sediminis]RCU56723.1 DNA-binding response regulator [Oceanihabitans sediminis]
MTKQQEAKILIVEDDVIIAEYISEILQEEHFKNIKIAHDKELALYEMEQFKPDIILMDINLKGKNSGIELSKVKNKNATVIFITGQQDYSLMSEALKTNPDAYLTKPLKRVDLLASINLAIFKKQSQTFQFKDGYDLVSLDYDDIKYIVADGNYVNIQTVSKKYTIRKSLNTVAEKLPSVIFKRSHRSYIVNINKVQRVSYNFLIINNVEIPLSRSFSKSFK